MEARKCDRCGKYFDVNPNGKFEGEKVMLFPLEGYWARETANLAKDLCAECSTSFRDWFKIPKIMEVNNVENTKTR